jgi:A/G-specific adenine glycosylase
MKTSLPASSPVNVRRLRNRLLAWFDRHGRKNLPWQRSRDPYRIWVSEIMLQQTQVSTVIPYYERFLKRFPDIQTLARARIDSVLHLWTGLGYYARARHLKKAAEIIVREHDGKFPRDIDTVSELPGIGRSTAGAILAFAYQQRQAILDGNVKRVLTRLHAIDTPVLQRVTQDTLWSLAEHYTPRKRIADYTQAIMDLGATVCRTRKPACRQCPFVDDCRAHAMGLPETFPVRTPRKKLPVRQTIMLLIRDPLGRVLLTQRPPAGLWGGLWGFPECASTSQATKFCRQTLGLNIQLDEPWPKQRHGFSHFHLDITPLPAQLVGTALTMKETAPALWLDLKRVAAKGMAAPVNEILIQLRKLENRRATTPAVA